MSEREKVKPVKLVDFNSDDDSPHVPTTAELDAEEEEFRKLRVDMPGVKGASSIGIVGIGVSKTPGKNEFYRTHRDFRPTVEMANHEEGMERQYFVVSAEMKVALEGIGIGVSPHTLYLTVTSRGALKVVPVRIADGDFSENEYTKSKELGLIQAMDEWVRLYTDKENKCYRVFSAPVGRFPEPQWPALKHARIFKLAFKDRGHLIDSPEHVAFKKWAARDR